MIFIGIDPGKEGAIAAMDGERKTIAVHDTPLLPSGDYDVFAAYRLAQDACWNGAVEACVLIEDTISVPHLARGERFLPASDKWLHMSLGIWRAVFASFPSAKVSVIHPKTWKASMFAGVPNDDAAEEMALKRRFAGHDLAAMLRGPKGGKRPGRVDAIAICEHARVTWRLTGRRAA
jgi:hypothetical protein